MRSPAQNRLDARAAYEVTAVFEHQGRLHALIDGGLLHAWDSTARDWRELYSVRSHWRAGQSYPLDLFVAALGPGLSADRSQESIFRVIGTDAALNGRFAGKFSALNDSSWASAAPLGDRLWTIAREQREPALLSKQIGTGRTERHLLGTGSGDYAALHAFDTGLLIADTRAHALYHIPRQRLDPAYSPPAPAAETTARP